MEDIAGKTFLKLMSTRMCSVLGRDFFGVDYHPNIEISPKNFYHACR